MITRFYGFYGKRLLKISLLALVLSLFIMSAGAVWDYSLDYLASGMGGSISETSDYNVVDLINATGIDNAFQSSANYDIIPVVGLKNQAKSSVAEWYLY